MFSVLMHVRPLGMVHLGNNVLVVLYWRYAFTCCSWGLYFDTLMYEFRIAL